MFYGLNNFIKKVLPKRLFYRALIIVAAPVIILQLTISIVFFDSIWIKANKGMTRSLVSEIQTLVDVYSSNQSKDDIKKLTDLYKKNFDFVINIKTGEILPETRSDRRFSPMDRSLRREMKSGFSNNYWFNNDDNIWDSEDLDFVLIGDSFTHGACVTRDQNIAGKLISLGYKTLNLGYSAIQC